MRSRKAIQIIILRELICKECHRRKFSTGAWTMTDWANTSSRDGSPNPSQPLAARLDELRNHTKISGWKA
jgi:hypothetical protein